MGNAVQLAHQDCLEIRDRLRLFEAWVRARAVPAKGHGSRSLEVAVLERSLEMKIAATVTSANGTSFGIPMFDPVVSARFKDPSSYAPTLMEEVFVKEIYAPLFKGRKDLTFLDIGANIGLVSLYAYDACRRIVALEPDPDTFTVLKSMTLKHPNIEPVCAALAPVDGQVDFYRNHLNTTASSTVNTFGTQTKCTGLTLISILGIHQLEHVDVCKCDAEGAEGESLTIEQLRAAAPVIDTWMIELHNCPLSTWGQKLGRLVNDFSELGYHSQRIDGMALIVSK